MPRKSEKQDDPVTRWKCPECGHVHEVPAHELAVIGTPHCPECNDGTEMYRITKKTKKVKRFAELSWCGEDVVRLAKDVGCACDIVQAENILFECEDDLLVRAMEFIARLLTDEILATCRKIACGRCGGSINPGGYCQDETCPFSSHKQDCGQGWIGHPDHSQKAEDVCCTCGSLDDYGTEDDCPRSPTGKHEADGNLTQADGLKWIVDVCCKHCGRSGGVRVIPEEIGW